MVKGWLKKGLCIYVYRNGMGCDVTALFGRESQSPSCCFTDVAGKVRGRVWWWWWCPDCCVCWERVGVARYDGMWGVGGWRGMVVPKLCACLHKCWSKVNDTYLPTQYFGLDEVTDFSQL